MATNRYVYLVLEGISEPQKVQADELRETGIRTYDLMRDGKKVGQVAKVNSYWFEDEDNVVKVKHH